MRLFYRQYSIERLLDGIVYWSHMRPLNNTLPVNDDHRRNRMHLHQGNHFSGFELHYWIATLPFGNIASEHVCGDGGNAVHFDEFTRVYDPLMDGSNLRFHFLADGAGGTEEVEDLQAALGISKRDRRSIQR